MTNGAAEGGTATGGTPAGLSDLRATIELELAGFSGRISVAYRGLMGASPAARCDLGWNVDEPMPAASLIKLPILACALEAAELGELDLERRTTLRADDVVSGDGVLRHLLPGLEPTLFDLLTLMTIVSDNTATNLALESVGSDRVRRWIRAAGMAGTELVGGLQLPPERRSEAQKAGAFNRTTAADVLGLLLALERGDLLPGGANATMQSLLERNLRKDGIGGLLPIDLGVPDADGRSVRVASKEGCIAGVWHDAAIVRRADGAPLFALAVLSADSDDRAEHWMQEGLVRIRRIARAAFEATSG